jgi:hypothetical protein
MKSFQSPQRVVIIFLTLFIMLCCFLIVRLEIKAANLQSRWNEHQAYLEKNMDILEDLDVFTRSTKKGAYLDLNEQASTMVGGNSMIITGSAGIYGGSDSDIKFGSVKWGSVKKPIIDYFGYDSKSRSTFLRGVNKGNVFVRSNSGDCFLRIDDDWIALNSRDKNNYSLGLDITPSFGKVEITNGGGRANITLNKEDISIDGKNEIDIEGKILTMVNASGKCKMIMAEEDIHIVCASSKGPVFGVQFSSSTQSIAFNTVDASFIIANDVIHFNAEGDINITSKNGNVNIKGKKVKVNE